MFFDNWKGYINPSHFDGLPYPPGKAVPQHPPWLDEG